MAFSYMGGKGYGLDVSRSERFFCAELYRQAKEDLLPLLGLMQNDLEIDPHSAWEISVEVSFYRDFCKMHGRNTPNGCSSVRTIDVVLFSNSQIILVEAKAQQGMTKKETEKALNDVVEIKKLACEHNEGNNVRVDLVALVSSLYKSRHYKNSRVKILENYKSVITWKDLSDAYHGNPLFSRADKIYKQ